MHPSYTGQDSAAQQPVTNGSLGMLVAKIGMLMLMRNQWTAVALMVMVILLGVRIRQVQCSPFALPTGAGGSSPSTHTRNGRARAGRGHVEEPLWRCVATALTTTQASDPIRVLTIHLPSMV
jgi:hypothetical protein